MDVFQQLGVNNQKKIDFPQTLFYFMREFHINPFDEEWIVDGKKIIKKGMPIPLFTCLVEEMKKHYEREKHELDKINHRR